MNPRIETEADWRIRVFDSLSFPTLILKPDLTIVAANHIFLKKIGVSLESILGLTCREISQQYFHDQCVPCSEQECPMINTLKYQKGHSVLRKVKNPDGKERWEDRVFSPILDDDGNVLYVIESVRDVTRVKTLERMYTGIRELIDKVIHSSASAIVAADMKGKIILMNEAAEVLFGYSFSEADCINIKDMYPEGTAYEIMKKLRDENLSGKGKLPVTNVDILTKNKELIPVEMTAAIIYEDEIEAATMGIFNDLRDKLAVEKKLQDTRAQLMQSEKLASLGRLAAGVAHEINNPLTSILLYGNLMLEKLESEDPTFQNLKYVLEDAERCRLIVKDLLAYSRQASPSRKIFPLNHLVEESLGLIRDRKLFMNVTIVKNLEPSPIFINADKNQLCQVLINLIINAVDAMERNGTLTFRTFRDPENKMAVLDVTDTGCGISEDNLSKVFDPFFTTKDLGRGTGLGLSTAYGIVNENQGNIFVRRTGPSGTTFRLKLPEVSAPKDEPPEQIK